MKVFRPDICAEWLLVSTVSGYNTLKLKHKVHCVICRIWIQNSPTSKCLNHLTAKLQVSCQPILVPKAKNNRMLTRSAMGLLKLSERVCQKKMVRKSLDRTT